MARPNLSYLKNLVLTSTGLACGTWSSLTGISAAQTSSPALSWLIGLRDPRLNAVAICVAISSSFTSLLAFGQSHLIDVPLALIFVVTSTLGALIAGYPLFQDIRDPLPARIFWRITLLIGGFGAIFLAIRYGHSSAILALGSRPDMWILKTLAAGLAVGFYGRLSGTGPAAVVIALIAIGHQSPLSAIATAMTVYVLVSLAPVALYLINKVVGEASMGWPMFGAAIGGLVGSRIAVAQSSQTLMILYGIGLVALAVILLRDKEPATDVPLKN